MDQIREEQQQYPKEQRFTVAEILRAIKLSKSTYYDERQRILHPSNKYDHIKQAKQAILKIIEEGRVCGRLTYGYRRVKFKLEKLGIHLADATVESLMYQLGVQVSLYNRHRNHQYHSYIGRVGMTADNLLNQTFDKTEPYQVIHTDVSQIKLANGQWAYISVMLDEASKEILAFQISAHPDRSLIIKTLKQLQKQLPTNATPVIHSDQGWHYQLPYYVRQLKDHHFVQSMSRKGNCLDNAPIESFFHLFKAELLDGFPPCKDLLEFKKLSLKYVHYFNHERISLKTKGMTPVEYRNHALAV
ncbi:IS3 family transposase [Limosilactobacillus fastidiosus]|uniref:IS3 family transposase n=1 Tax=Limosilactobacillus fastidiosus TaxID=2759855 RepID=UPI001E2B5A4B|nr:IS3 family transposase [Limosilactobacillus fastidiosus]MCD7083970.1 IS3 family transposase [Limosilactobacillus fastidiosus]